MYAENIDEYDIFSLHTPLERIAMPVKFPHTTISSFLQAFKDLVHFRVYSKFHDILFGGFDKAIAMFEQQENTAEDGDIIDYGLPLLTFDLSITQPDHKIETYWRSSTLFTQLGRYIYNEPFYSDDDLRGWLTYRRINGTITAKAFCSSLPQQMDIQLAFTDIFQGGDRWIVTPIQSFTCIPSEFVFTTVHGKNISKILTEKAIGRQFIRAVNQNCFYLLSNSSPIIKLSNVSASNNLYGGKNLPEYILNLEFGFELEVPAYITMESVFKGTPEININVDFQTTNHPKDQLEEIFGKPDFLRASDHHVVCENGIVKGWNGIKLEENTGKLRLSDFYKSPRGFFLEEKFLHWYIYSPIGLFDASNFKIEKDEANDDYIMTLQPEGLEFQKGDLLVMFLYYPNEEDIINGGEVD